MKTDCTVYPPRLAADVEIAEQPDGERTAFIIGSASVGRYLLLRVIERQVVALLDGTRTATEVCDKLRQLTGAPLSVAGLAKFLAKLDSYGILAGERVQGVDAPEVLLSQMHYVRIRLFNPNLLFSRLVPKLRWIWTTGFFFFTSLAMLAAMMLALLHWGEVANYGWYVAREHYVAVFIAMWLISISHEFAHGLTCKAFGGRATEVGVLLVYYFLPALYCNVSGMHLIPVRSRRLWVIAAGVWWQLIIGAFAFFSWFILAPHTPLSDIAFIFLFADLVDVIFNANPLIKLDGYYFLSQWLGLPNLMDRSRAYWRGVLRRILLGEQNREAARYSRRERVIYLVFGLLSFTYNIAFASLILTYVGAWLIEQFYLLGLVLTFGLALLFLRRPIKQLLDAIATICKTKERKMADNNQTQVANKETSPPFWRRRLVPLALALVAILLLLLPWTASVGNYGTLVALPGQEAIIHAPESATLAALRVQPGDQVAAGAIIGQLGNFDLDEQIVQAQAELARAQADYDRLRGEQRTQQEAMARTEWQLRQRQHDYHEIQTEQEQIKARQQTQPAAESLKILAVSATPHWTAEKARAAYPPALAALQAEVDLRRAQLEEAQTQRTRARQLAAQGITPRSELDLIETRARTLALEMEAARERLDAALIDHQRKHTNTATEMNLARSDRDAATAQTERLAGELRAARTLITTLEQRRDLLQRKHAQFALTTPRSGAIFGAELPRMTGRFFQKGEEICRVADTRQLLLRIQVPEREIGDVRVGHPVRMKVRSFPDRRFSGVVSKIGGESELDENQQATYRVELTIENQDGALRPGMTAFARIEFSHQMIGLILWHKIKQVLRPELWIL